MKNINTISVSTKLSLIASFIFMLSLTLADVTYADEGDYITAQGTFTDVSTGIIVNLTLTAEEDLGEDYGHTKYKLYGRYAPERWAIISDTFPRVQFAQ